MWILLLAPPTPAIFVALGQSSWMAQPLSKKNLGLLVLSFWIKKGLQLLNNCISFLLLK